MIKIKVNLSEDLFHLAENGHNTKIPTQPTHSHFSIKQSDIWVQDQ